MTDDIIKRLREAIAAGPTPGPWGIGTPPPNGEQTIGTRQGLMLAVATTGIGMEAETLANATYIAAASPDNIAALLDRLDKAERENERLREWEACAREWLTKTEWVQTKDLLPRYLGRHRADIMRDQIERLRAENEKLRNTLRYAASCLGTDGNDPIDTAMATEQPEGEK